MIAASFVRKADDVKEIRKVGDSERFWSVMYARTCRLASLVAEISKSHLRCCCVRLPMAASFVGLCAWPTCGLLEESDRRKRMRGCGHLLCKVFTRGGSCSWERRPAWNVAAPPLLAERHVLGLQGTGEASGSGQHLMSDRWGAFTASANVFETVLCVFSPAARSRCLIGPGAAGPQHHDLLQD